jgi:NMD protein affecting ribosome stability and mRNA decay
MLVCKKCKAVKIDNKWIPSTNLRRKVTFTLCPTCTTEIKQTSNGILMIDGVFFKNNADQSLQLIQSEENKARKENVYSRIVQIQKNIDPVVIKTTNSNLAIQIGRSFKRQFKGELDISENRRTGVTVKWSSEPVPAEKTTASE